MAVKLCVNCEHHRKEVIQVAPGNYGHVDLCGHEDCMHPVSGEPVMCDQARREVVFCGFAGRFYKQKTTPDSTESKIVQV